MLWLFYPSSMKCQTFLAGNTKFSEYTHTNTHKHRYTHTHTHTHTQTHTYTHTHTHTHTQKDCNKAHTHKVTLFEILLPQQEHLQLINCISVIYHATHH